MLKLKISIIYFSKTGKTKKMADVVADGMRSVQDTEVKAFSLDEIDYDFVAKSSAVVFGTPTYYANICWQLKK
jgi:NAD(P)H dehydrogenase (quinone)